MNNYNMSDSGENIEFNVSYDTGLAQIYFNEWLDGADGTQVTGIDLGGRDNYLYLIGDSDAPYYKKSELQKIKKAALFDLWQSYDLDGGYSSVNDYKKSEYIADLLTVTIKRHYEYLASQYHWHNLSDNIPHDYFISRGYSQGDAVYVVKIDGLDSTYSRYIDHIFWDSPISGMITVNGNEFYIDELLDDYYLWDSDTVKAKIMGLDISDYAKAWLCDNVPNYPEYN